MKFDTHQEVTDAILAKLEAGTKPWAPDWQGGGLTMPMRATGQQYQGINVLLLWMASQARHYTGSTWMTFKQARDLGGMVRKGEKATRIVFYKQLTVGDREAPEGSDETKKIPMLRTYAVFNVDQIDDLPEKYRLQNVEPLPGITRDSQREAVLRATGADIREGGASAYYMPGSDHVQMPDFERFTSASGYLATLAHELVHWTGHKSRLDRFGANTRTDYAAEELVAELGAAMVGARLGIIGEHIDNHAAYLAHWLKALKDDKRAIFKAATLAQKAADMVLANATAPTTGPGESEPAAKPEPAPAPQLALAL